MAAVNRNKVSHIIFFPARRHSPLTIAPGISVDYIDNAAFTVGNTREHFFVYRRASSSLRAVCINLNAMSAHHLPFIGERLYFIC